MEVGTERPAVAFPVRSKADGCISSVLQTILLLVPVSTIMPVSQLQDPADRR